MPYIFMYIHRCIHLYRCNLQQVKQNLISSTIDMLHELFHELPKNDLSLKFLENYEVIEKISNSERE